MVRSEILGRKSELGVVLRLAFVIYKNLYRLCIVIRQVWLRLRLSLLL